ncbi:hypothetical protein AN4989.2 [Aspergillus nidulans FGSC A4]|nr:hypothetical protein AN4989.2 [Aspergillus nidulans FGSC A4]|eukprot:XP_662593.1 hypothetical protein AN4989.2 [Aspergillus nidulans FGSC A4]
MANRLIPLVVLLIVVVVLAVIGFVAYSIIQEVSDKTRSKMEKRNVMFTKDGMKVGVREVGEEEYVDRSQSILVNIWNHTSFPAYKSRLWNMTGSTGSASGTGNGEFRAEHRKGKLSLPVPPDMHTPLNWSVQQPPAKSRTHACVPPRTETPQSQQYVHFRL